MLAIKKPIKKLTIESNSDMVDMVISLYPCIKEFKNEIAFCIFLDENNSIIEVDVIGEGTPTEVSIPTLELIKRAIAIKAKNIGVFHTHPLNNALTFSTLDYNCHRLINNYAKEFNINLIETGVINYNKKLYLSKDNNIYECKGNNYRKLFKSYKNSLLKDVHTLYLNFQGVNKIKELIMWG